MRILDVVPSFKRYALFERGMMPKSVKEIITIVILLSNQISTQNLSSITTSKIRDFLHQRKAQRLWTNKTFRNNRQYLKSFFNYCVRENYILINPVEKIEKPKIPKRLPRCLNKQQIDKLLLNLDCYEWFNVLEEKRNKAIIRTFLFTGIRLSELLKLKTNAINFEEYEILIQQGKGRKDRIVPIHPDLMPYLKSYAIVKKKKITKYFFSSIRSDKPLTEKNLYRIFKVLRRVCRFHFTPHQLRHTFGKLSIEANLNPFKLQSIMGHSSISTTQIYISVSTKNIKESFQKLELI